MDRDTGIKAGAAMALMFGAAWAVLSVQQPEPEPEPTPEPIPEPAGPSVEVQVLGEDGRAPADCAGTLTLRVDSGGRRLDADSTLACGAQGRMAWTDLEPGTWRLAAAGEGTEVREEDIDVQGPVDLGIWVLRPGGNVSGTVTVDGEPLLGAQIRTPTGQKSVSITDGRYVLRGVPAGTVEVFAGFEDQGGSGVVEVLPGEVATLDLALETVEAKGVVGVLFEASDEGLVVTRVHPGGPAREVAPGSLVTAVDGVDTRDLSQAEAKALLAGPPGTPVELEVDGERLSLIRVDLAKLP